MREELKKELDREKSEAQGGGKAWYCFGDLHNRLFISGPHITEEEADRIGTLKFPEDYEVRGFSNRYGQPLGSKSEATSRIKSIRMGKENLDLEEATRYARHNNEDI